MERPFFCEKDVIRPNILPITFHLCRLGPIKNELELRGVNASYDQIKLIVSSLKVILLSQAFMYDVLPGKSQC